MKDRDREDREGKTVKVEITNCASPLFHIPISLVLKFGTGPSKFNISIVASEYMCA